jgi:hypothetical protein
VDDARVVINELATNGIAAAPGDWMEISIRTPARRRTPVLLGTAALSSPSALNS